MPCPSMINLEGSESDVACDGDSDAGSQFPPQPPLSMTFEDPLIQPLTGTRYDDILNSAAVDTKPTSFETKQPWERGLMKLTFNKDSVNPSLPEVQVHPMPLQVPSSSVSSSAAVQQADVHGPKPDSTFLKCVRKVADTDDWTKQDSLRKAAINKFSTLISLNPAAFHLGRVVQAESTFMDFEENLAENLEMIFGLKSAATLNKLANAIYLFVKAAVDRDRAPFPSKSPKLPTTSFI